MVKKNQRSKPKDFYTRHPRPAQIQKVFKAEIGNSQPSVPDGGTYQGAQETPHPWGCAPAMHFPALGTCQGAISTVTKHSYTTMWVPGMCSRSMKDEACTKLPIIYTLPAHCPLTLMKGFFNCGKISIT